MSILPARQTHRQANPQPFVVGPRLPAPIRLALNHQRSTKNCLKRDRLVFLLLRSDILAKHANIKMQPGSRPPAHADQIPASREFEWRWFNQRLGPRPRVESSWRPVQFCPGRSLRLLGFQLLSSNSELPSSEKYVFAKQTHYCSMFTAFLKKSKPF